MSVMNRFCSLLLLAAAAAYAADLQTILMDHTQTVDELGDGTIAMKLTLDGEMFQRWQSRYGQNQSLLKRDMAPYTNRYETSDWEMQVNQMDRIVTIAMKVKGAVLHRGGGVFEFRVPKSWRGGERHENVFSFNFVEPVAANAVTQHNVKLNLPAGASQFADDKSETGDRVIRYHMLVGRTSWMTWAGLAAVLLGGVTAAYGLWGMKRA